MVHPLDRAWDTLFPGWPPLGYVLRGAFPDLHVRIWSLPDGTRYPTTAEQSALLLARHGEVFAALFEPGASLWLLWPDHRGPGEVGLHDPPEPFARAARLWRTFPPEETGLAGAVTIDAVLVEWQPRLLDPLILAVADERLSGCLVVDLAARAAVWLYDGGMDLFARDPSHADALRRRWPGMT